VQRRVDLNGPSNFRDLGGLPLADGGMTCFGRVFRADRLCTLSDGDLQHLNELDIRTVFDLRSDPEVAEFPDRLPHKACYVRLPMTSDTTFRSRTIYERIVAGEVTSYGETEMVEGYLRILTNFSAGFASITKAVSEGDPVLIHCTAGKDRTGVAAMLLLDLAGVATDQIVADYELSAQRRPSPERDHTEAKTVTPLLEDHGLDPALFAPLWEARGAVMQATLAGFYDKWGNAAGYLRAAGLDEAHLQAAQRRLRG